MKTYKVMGSLITAEDAAEFVQKMHKESHTPAESDRAFMVQVADRAKLQNGAVVSTDTADNFLSDLIGCGLVEEVT